MENENSLEQQAEIINKAKAHWIGLQEIDKKCNRSGNIDQVDMFATLTNSAGFFGKFMDYDSGEYGLASLSRLKIKDSKILPLPEGAEPRVALIQTVEINNNLEVVMVNLHLDWTTSDRRLPQAKTLLDTIKDVKHPVIIIGDFNAEPGSPTLQLFEKNGFLPVKKEGDRLTWNAITPTKELDHIYYRSTKKIFLNPEFIEILQEPTASDHRPVLAGFRITQKRTLR
jgi:endonuclease/exonuclease/phosphatase family metal-dependent hydrolase